MRVDVCASDDELTLTELVLAIEQVGGSPADHDGQWVPGMGLNRYVFPGGELTVFVDAWAVDLAGPDELVQRVIAAMKVRD